MPRFQRSVRPILNVGELMHGPIRYEKPAGNVSPDEYRNHMMQQAQQSQAYAEQQRKAHPTQAPAPKPETPGFWETYWQVPGKLLDVAKDKIDPHTDKVPGLHALSRAPGTVYEGVAKAIPQGIKDINIAGYRLGDAADAVAQTFSPVSLDPKATPTDHAAQFGMAWSGQKALGKGAQALGKHGGKIINGAGLGAMFGPDAVAGAADHAARMFGREVPSMAAAGGPRLGIAPHTPAPRPMPQKANMAGGKPGDPVPWYDAPGVDKTPAWQKAPEQFKSFKDSMPTPEKKPGLIKRGADYLAKNPGAAVLAAPIIGGAGATAIGTLGMGARLGYNAYQDWKNPEVNKRIRETQKSVGDRSKRLREAAYKEAAQRKEAERQRDIQRRQQQGGR